MDGDPIVELRVHGVHGTDPEGMVGDPFPVQVAGDDAARFLRAHEPTRDGVTVEALHWARFTSGSPTRALWLLLVPFAIVDLAGYTMLPGPRALHAAVRLVLRLLGALLTVTLTVAVAHVAMDLVMHQCAAAPACVDRNAWLTPFRDAGDGWRFGVGVLPPAGLIALLWWFGRQTFLYDPPADTMGRFDRDRDTLGDLAFWHTGVLVVPLRAAHVTVACATLGALCVTAAGAGWAAWLYAVPLLAGLVMVAQPAWFVDEHPAGPAPLPVRAVVTAVAVVMLAAGAVGSTVVAALAPAPPPSGPAVVPYLAPLHGFEAAARVTLVGMVGCLLAVAVLCAVLRLRPGRPEAPPAFRPYWAGFAPLVLAALAVTLAGGFSAGVVFWTADLLGRVTSADALPAAPVVPDADALFQWSVVVGRSYLDTAHASGVAVAVLVPVLVVIVLLALRGPASALRPLVDADYAREAPAPDPQPLWPVREPDMKAKVARTWRWARTKYRLHWVLGAVAAAGGAGSAVTAVSIWLPSTPDGWQGLGAAALTAVAGGFVTLGLRSWSSPALRATVGVLWDLLAFWPRHAHPLCPPPYGGRTVLELARRAAFLGRENRIVLSGHSQGSLICLAATLVLAAERDEPDPSFIATADAAGVLRTLGLLTYGSQLQWAYARLFPHYAGHHVLARVHGETVAGRWHNLHRYTDPLGGPVLAWPQDGTPAPHPGKDLWLTVADRVRPHRPRGDAAVAGRVGPEIRLRDPVRVETAPDAVRDPLRGHGDYWADPAFPSLVREVADRPAVAPQAETAVTPQERAPAEPAG